MHIRKPHGAQHAYMERQGANFLLEQMSFLSNKRLATIKILAEPRMGEQARHKSRALIVFEGVSNTLLDVKCGVRTLFEWQPYNIQLSLSEKALSRENLGKHIAKGAGMYISVIHQDVIERVYEYAKERVENIHGHTGKSRGEWNLVFSGNSPREIIGRKAGTITASVRKYEAYSKGALRAEEEFAKATCIDPTSCLRHILKGKVSEHPLMAGEMEYEISEDSVRMVQGFAHAPEKAGEYPRPTLVTWTDIDITNLNPQGRTSTPEHRIHMLLWIAGIEEPVVKTKSFPGPIYTPLGNE